MAKEQKPFHESVVDFIERASEEQLRAIITLLHSTKIPKNHDQILAVWKKRCDKYQAGFVLGGDWSEVLR